MVKIFCNVCEKDITDKTPIIVNSKFQICNECLQNVIKERDKFLGEVNKNVK